MSRLASKQDEDARRHVAPATLTTREAAARLGVNERTVRRAIARGEIAAVRQGGAYRIAAATLDQIAPLRPMLKLVAFPSTTGGMTPPPTPLTPFVGREETLAAVEAMLRDPVVRLLTLTGPGGIGKTRLALRAATTVVSEFPDGVVFVDLAAIAREDLVLPAIAAALGVREPAQQDLLSRVRSFLASRRLLLVLDNFEHLLTAAPVVSQLLATAHGLTALVTSRTPLRLSGEREFLVPPLSVPGPGGGLSTDTLLASDAGQLFVERARAVDTTFALDERAAASVAEICTRLEGVPLAIELAAARVKAVPPRQLRDRLEHRLSLLTAAPRDAAPRHATMRDAIAWSYDLASAAEQRLFRTLTVFSGGFTLDAAEGVAEEVLRSASAGAPAVLDLIGGLVDQSLLVRETGLDGEPRYRMLETIREYGQERLTPAEEVTARNAHAGCFLRLAVELRPLANTRSTRAPLDHLEAEGANLRAALDWLESRGQLSDVACLVAACYTSLFALSHFREAENWLTRARVAFDHASDADRARLVIGTGELFMVQGQFAAADASLAEGLMLVRARDEPFDLAMALLSRGASLNYGGEYAAAEPFLQEAITVAEAIADPRLRAAVEGRGFANLGVSARGRGDLPLAATRTEQALVRFHGMDLELAETRTLMDLGDIARDQGESRLAVTRYLASIMASGEQVELRMVAEALEGIACVASGWGQDRTALLLFGAADAVRERIGFGMRVPVDVVTLERHLGALRTSLGDSGVEVVLAEGQTLSLDEAVRVAAGVVAPGDDAADSGDFPGMALTEREQEVLRLLAARRTDREIAEALYISPRTVNWHVRSILSKLGAESRREAAALALGNGLV